MMRAFGSSTGASTRPLIQPAAVCASCMRWRIAESHSASLPSFSTERVTTVIVGTSNLLWVRNGRVVQAAAGRVPLACQGALVEHATSPAEAGLVALKADVGLAPRREAVAAVDRLGTAGPEGHEGLTAAAGARRAEHLARAAVVAAAARVA